MNIITISREFGSGGRELGKRLADMLNYDYYDSEIISRVAKTSGIAESYVDVLDNHGWKNQTVSFRNTLGSRDYIQSSKVEILLKQKKVIEDIASLGNDFVIVGRNADIILKDYKPFNIFVCATKESKLKRCRERAAEGEMLSEKELLREMKRIDKVRAQTREILSESPWGSKEAYHLTVNTTDRSVKETAAAVCEYFKSLYY